MKTPLNKAEILALTVTQAIGSITSVVIHTVLFLGAFTLVLLGVDLDRVLLVLTTIVSLEAIYLSIFIQMDYRIIRCFVYMKSIIHASSK